MATSDLTVLILTFNEEKHIERCIRSALQVARQVYVVDSFSSDGTVAMAEALGARVWQHAFINNADQFGWAMKNLPILTRWVMRVDADEVITPGLAESMRRSLAYTSLHVNGFLVCRYVRFMGKLIRHGNFPQWNLRVWRNGTAEIEQRWMDEHIVLNAGEAERLKGEFIDDNLNNISWWTGKHDGYSTREAIDLLNHKYHFLKSKDGVISDQARYKRWFKENIYGHLPIGFRAFALFFYRMVFQFGFLDGRAGFFFHFLQGFWYRFLVDMKVWEVEQRMRTEGIECVEAIRREFGINPVYATAGDNQPAR